MSGREFIKKQDEQIEVAHAAYVAGAREFVNVWEKHADLPEQRRLLLDMHSAGTAYYRQIESAIFDRGELGGDDYNAWLNGWTSSARKVLDGLPQYHKHLRNYRDDLHLPATMFEPPNGAYQNIQQFFAATSAEDVRAFKARFEAAKLPVRGFDHPYKPKPAPKDMKMPLFLLIVSIFGLLALACIGGGIYAVYHDSTANTAFDFLGFHLHTGHVGVAFVGIGLATAYFTTTAVLKRL